MGPDDTDLALVSRSWLPWLNSTAGEATISAMCWPRRSAVRKLPEAAGPSSCLSSERPPEELLWVSP